ncbi:hypothetical protein B0H19DRAFT_1334314 [Mycena capillaripes]|nr:hypothetical protein B0H19DRAFT_1334314 [Mycena capillaripes]
MYLFAHLIHPYLDFLSQPRFPPWLRALNLLARLPSSSGPLHSELFGSHLALKTRLKDQTSYATWSWASPPAAFRIHSKFNTPRISAHMFSITSNCHFSLPPSAEALGPPDSLWLTALLLCRSIHAAYFPALKAHSKRRSLSNLPSVLPPIILYLFLRIARPLCNPMRTCVAAGFEPRSRNWHYSHDARESVKTSSTMAAHCSVPPLCYTTPTDADIGIHAVPNMLPFDLVFSPHSTIGAAQLCSLANCTAGYNSFRRSRKRGAAQWHQHRPAQQVLPSRSIFRAPLFNLRPCANPRVNDAFILNSRPLASMARTPSASLTYLGTESLSKIWTSCERWIKRKRPAHRAFDYVDIFVD